MMYVVFGEGETPFNSRSIHLFIGYFDLNSLCRFLGVSLAD